MSAIVKLSSKLPGDPEINGLDSLHKELLLDPHQIVCAIVWLKVKDVRQIIEGPDDGPAEIPTVGLARIEPIDVVDRVPAEIQKLAAELYEKRTGRDPLPMSQLVGSMDQISYSTSSPELIED